MPPATAKTRHRSGVIERDGLVCWLAENPEHVCGGRLQSCHLIAVQRLVTAHGIANGRRGQDEDPLRGADLDEIIADPANGILSCEVGHRQMEKGKFKPPVSDELLAFSRRWAMDWSLLRDGLIDAVSTESLS